MDGPKRLAFTTLDSATNLSDKEKKVEKTVRLEVNLLDSTDTTYPEFSYTDLVKTNAPGDRTLSTNANSEDPFNDDDDADQLAAIAKRFEDKYNKPEPKKKKKKKWQDDHYMLELGDGYDENDTFIDNSEAYDEIMPENMTTKLGGFYINSGRLTLKEMSDDSEDDFQPETVKKSKKRRISSDEDSDSEEKKKIVKKKKVKDSLNMDGEIKKKKKKKIIPPGEEQPFKKPKQLQDKEKKKENKSSTVAALIKSSSPNLNGDGQENGIMSMLENGEADDHQSVTDAIDAVAAGKEDSNNSQDVEELKKDVDPESIPKLPNNLPAGMDDKIEQLKKQAKESRDGKLKFFTTEVNKILLELEMTSKQMTVGNRSSVFGHLAAYLPCSKDTLMKRAKTLRVKDLEDKIKAPVQKLKQAVDRLMPALQEKYEEECKRFAHEKQEKLVNEQKEETNKEENQTESDDEEGKTNQSENTKKRQNGPRKKFEWDNNARTLLCNVVRIKMQTFQLSKGRSETAEEFCKAFLDRDVRPIWPKGWMQKGVLFKESRPAHVGWTNPQKPKKLQLISKTPGAGATSNTALKSGITTSAPPGISVSKVNLNTAKNNPVSSTPSAVNSSNSSIQGTPTVVSKNITPTFLNYDSMNGSQRGNSNLSNSSSSFQKQSSNNTTSISNTSTKNTNPNDTNKTTPTSNQPEKSWDHVVSDILRSSITGTSPPKMSPNQPLQRQSSPASATGSPSTYMSQFEKFTKTAAGKDLSPKSLSTAQQQFLQKQIQQRISGDKALQQLKLLENQSKILQQARKHQAVAKQQLSSLQHSEVIGKHLVPQQNQAGNQLKAQSLTKQQISSLQAEAIGKHLAQQQKQTGNQPKSPTLSKQQLSTLQEFGAFGKQFAQQQKQPGNQPKSPSQSPMSMAMGRNPTQKVTPKQLSNVFQKSPERVSLLTENVIRKQLNDSTSRKLVSVSVSPTGSVQKLGVNQSSPTDHLYGRVSSSMDQLRKSPQVSPMPIITSQTKQGQGHITVTNTQNLIQGHVLHNNPSSKPVTSMSKPSQPGLLQSLFASPNSVLSNNSVPSLTTTSGFTSQAVKLKPTSTVSPVGTQSTAEAILKTSHPSFSSGNVGKPQGYSITHPALQEYATRMKIPTLTTQQIAMFKEVAKQQQQQRNVETTLGANRTPTDSMK